MATQVCNRTVRLLNEAIVGAGGPEHLVTSVTEPTIASHVPLPVPAAAVLDHLGPGADVVVPLANGEPVTVLDAIEAAPKSMKWKLRAKIGTRRIWYQEVTEKSAQF